MQNSYENILPHSCGLASFSTLYEPSSASFFQTFVRNRPGSIVISTLSSTYLSSTYHHISRGMYLTQHLEGCEISLWESVCFSATVLPHHELFHTY